MVKAVWGCMAKAVWGLVFVVCGSLKFGDIYKSRVG